MDITKIALVLSLFVCVSPAHAQPSNLAFENVFPNVTFTRPVDFENDGTDRVYIVQQTGEIMTLLNDPSVASAETFLDLSSRVLDPEEHGEAGLLSLAFHPDYEENGYFYVYYVTDEPMSTGEDTLHSVLARFERSPDDPSQADVSSEQILLEIPKPTDRHNGGGLAFGLEGYLYLSLGEGSYGGDTYDHAQNRKTLLGSVLRIDVDDASGDRNYGIPPDNPYVDNDSGYREEIYAYGLRNPWRLSVDSETGDIWLGDVGELTWEEVNRITKGGNYGWPVMEGEECYKAETCDRSGLIEPVIAYRHTEENGRCITGGYVYRGDDIPELYGTYVFGDWSSRNLWFLEFDSDEPSLSKFEPSSKEQNQKLKHYPSFGTDKDGELYYLSIYRGTVFRLRRDPALQNPDDTVEVAGTEFEISGPNPTPTAASVRFQVPETTPVRVAVYDLLGREVRVLHDGVVPGGAVRHLQISANQLPAGTYFFRMRSRGFRKTHKIVLLP